ncbi:unnamed protein product [Staurois parvus]|uniref:Uncharacterized protein n=1 Tax=Staurois parvus TaxID=386267 RepID=A0ABN9DJQ7_9NEOB|nr:unnamed protein product [Staurois parvus]
MPLTFVISGKNVPYIGDQWEECPLHWWPVGRMPLTLASGKNVPYIVVASGKNALYISGQWEECALHWWPVEECSLHWLGSGKNVPYQC